MNWKPLVTAAAVLSASTAIAQVRVEVDVPLPTIRFSVPPPVVVVSPGVHVVEDYDYEVFVVDGWYWYCDDHRWYRARDHRGGWTVVEQRYVPAHLVKHPRGKYKHYKRAHAEPAHYRREYKGDDHVREYKGDDRKHEYKRDKVEHKGGGKKGGGHKGGKGRGGKH